MLPDKSRLPWVTGSSLGHLIPPSACRKAGKQVGWEPREPSVEHTKRRVSTRIRGSELLLAQGLFLNPAYSHFFLTFYLFDKYN